MKNINIKLATILLMLLASSCEFGDINDDPARPLDVSMSAIMPAMQTGISFNLGGEYVLFGSILVQQLDGGTTAQQADWTKYIIDGQDTDNMWQNTYTNALNMADIIIAKAAEDNAPHYAGVAKVMMITGIGATTDTFGDVPYSEAFQADDEVIATYDEQEDIYASIQALLSEAITDLEGDSPGGTPGGDDLIFGGDMTKWVKAAWSLKAKYFLHLSNVDTDAYANALDAINSGAIASNDDNFQHFYGSVANEPNPRYEFDLNRPGNVVVGQYFIDKLTDNNDPRLSSLNSVNSGFYTSINSPVPFINFAEVKLIEAEALLETGADLSEVKAALLEGVTASLVEVTGNIAGDADNIAYLDVLDTEFDALTTDEERLERIINEKFVITSSIAVEPWIDFRRTGFPADITPNALGNSAANPGGGIPRRLPYPENERLLNQNIPFTTINMQEKVWWDN